MIPLTRAPYHQESFTAAEREKLAPYFTNLDRPVFALVNLPEVVKGALFARYSRSPKSMRRLFLDEFVDDLWPAGGAPSAGPAAATADGGKTGRAERLYERVLTDYGDDSVAQLGAAHVACEQASNILTKVLEWSRLGSYLEQSTRYMFFDQPLGDRYRYAVPAEIQAAGLEPAYAATLDLLFDTYRDLVPLLTGHYERLHPQGGDPPGIWKASIRARVCDDLRGLLPAATLSNVGVFASAQSYEALILRMRAHPLAEVQAYGELIRDELRQVIPAFLRRLDLPERGGAWTRYLAAVATRMRQLGPALAAAAAGAGAGAAAEPSGGERSGELGHGAAAADVRLLEWDQDAEVKVAAAALFPYCQLSGERLLELARDLPGDERRQLLEAYVGRRENRRHRPGRAFERASYRFEIVANYAVFRDLQRHRMLTIEWQPLTTAHGFDTPEAIVELGAETRWALAMQRAADLYRTVAAALGGEIAQYAVPFAYRLRFYWQVNARELFHILELRTQPGGDRTYRRICQEMVRLLRDQAGHQFLTDAMCFVDWSDPGLGRLAGERRAAARRIL